MQPVVSASTANVFTGNAVIFTVTNHSSMPANVVYKWYINGTAYDDDNTFSYTPATAGSYTVKCIIDYTTTTDELCERMQESLPVSVNVTVQPNTLKPQIIVYAGGCELDCQVINTTAYGADLPNTIFNWYRGNTYIGQGRYLNYTVVRGTASGIIITCRATTTNKITTVSDPQSVNFSCAIGGNVRLETPDELTDTLLVESMVLNLADTSLFASLAQSDVKEIAIDTILVTANQDTIPNLVFANITTDTTLLVVSVSGNTLDYSYLQAQSGPSNLLSILYRKNKRNNSDLAYLPTLYKRDIRIYPNPSNGLFKIATVKNTTTAMQIEINDLIGNTMQRHIWDGSLYKEIDLSNYASGIYFVAVKGEGFSYNYKLIKE